MRHQGQCEHVTIEGERCSSAADCTVDLCHEHAVRLGRCHLTFADEPIWRDVLVHVLVGAATVAGGLGGFLLLFWLALRLTP